MERFLVGLLVVVFIGLVATIVWLLRSRDREGQWLASRERGLAGLGPPRKLPVLIECATCKHFDLEEGQAFIAQHPAFVAASQVRSPAQMSQKAMLDDVGNVVGWKDEVGETGKTTPLKAKWTDFGACAVHGEGRYKHDVCPQHEKALEAAS